MATKRDRVPPLLRAFGLLERVASAGEPVALQDLAADAGLPKPTVYRILAMLESAGLVSREPEGRRIAAGPRLMRFALDVQLSSAVRAPRHAILKRLADELGETVNLTMLDGSEVVYLDRVETEWPLRMTLQPGSHVPLHCTASGKLLLALLPAARRRRIVALLPLSRYTDNTITDAKSLDAELAAIRQTRVDTAVVLPPEPPEAPSPPTPVRARLRVLTGPSAGRGVPVAGDDFVLGRVGVQVAAIVFRDGDLTLVPREGAQPPMVNGEPVPAEGRSVRTGDGLEVAGTRLEVLAPE